MAFVLSSQSNRSAESTRHQAACRVHTCLRCHTAISSTEPCSFVFALYRICAPCAGQQQVAARLPASRTPWGADLARTQRR
jgi:hypothetical protein